MAAEILSCEVEIVIETFFKTYESVNPENEVQAIVYEIVESIVSKAIPESREIENKEGVLEETKEPDKRLPVLDLFLSVLNAPIINPVLSGYFLKVFEVFIERKQISLLSYLLGFKEYIEAMFKHVYDRHIADVIKKIVSDEDRFLAGTSGDEFIYDKMLIIDRLIDQIGAENPFEIIENSGYILCQLIQGRQHLTYFNDSKILKRVFDALISPNVSSLHASIDYLVELLKFHSPESSKKNTDNLYFIGYDNFEQIENKPEEKLDYSDMMILAANCLETIKTFLTVNKDYKNPTQFGIMIEPFGRDKLKTITLLNALMELKDDIFCQRFKELEMPSVLLQLMETYYMNTNLHALIVKIFSEAIQSNISFLVDMVCF